jgi:hypothetical protein
MAAGNGHVAPAEEPAPADATAATPAAGPDVEMQGVTSTDVAAAEPPPKPEFQVPELTYFQVLKIFLRFGCLAVGGPVRAARARRGERGAGPYGAAHSRFC